MFVFAAFEGKVHKVQGVCVWQRERGTERERETVMVSSRSSGSGEITAWTPPQQSRLSFSSEPGSCWEKKEEEEDEDEGERS